MRIDGDMTDARRIVGLAHGADYLQAFITECQKFGVDRLEVPAYTDQGDDGYLSVEFRAFRDDLWIGTFEAEINGGQRSVNRVWSHEWKGGGDGS